MMNYDEKYDTPRSVGSLWWFTHDANVCAGNDMREPGVEPGYLAVPDPKSRLAPSSEPSSPRANDQGAAQRHTAPGIAGASTTRITTRKKSRVITEFRLGEWVHVPGEPIPCIAALRRPSRSHHCYIYGIRRPDTRAVKIGRTWNVKERLGLLQVCNDVELEVVLSFACVEAAEKLIHEMLAPWRIRGEWFAPSPEVEDWIARQSRQAQSAA